MSKKASKKEQRAFMFDVRATQDDRGNYIEGRPVVYGKEADIGGMFREEITPGALDKTDLHDVCFLTNHDLNRIPLARSRNNNKNSTLQLTVDKEGLKIRAYLDTENNADAKALYSAVERGDITGMSFMFWIEEEDERWEDLDTDYPKRFIEKISTIVEVSAVTFPAYEDTSIMARDKDALESAKKALESVRSKSLESDELELWKEKVKLKGAF